MDVRLVPSRLVLALLRIAGLIGVVAAICMIVYDVHMFLACDGHFDVCDFAKDSDAIHFSGSLILGTCVLAGVLFFGSDYAIRYYHDMVLSGEIVDKHITSGCESWMIYVKGKNRVGKVKTYGWAVTTGKWQQLQIGDQYTRPRR